MNSGGATGEVTEDVDVTEEGGVNEGGGGEVGGVAEGEELVGRDEFFVGAGRGAGRSAERDGPAAEEPVGAAVGDTGATPG